MVSLKLLKLEYLFKFSVGNYGASWHVAEGDISSAYRAFSNEKIFGRMGVYVGLKQVCFCINIILSSPFNFSLKWDRVCVYELNNKDVFVGLLVNSN